MTRFMLAAALAANFAIPAIPALAAANVSCSVPNHVSCTVTSNRGLQRVRFMVDTPQGEMAIVDESYRNCPREVKVHYDSAFNVHDRDIRECRGIVGGGGGLKLAR